MSDIKIKSKVECSDGPCGKITHLVADPGSGKLTHVVVKDKNLPNSPDRLVPVGMVGDSTGGVIKLNCTRKELVRMPPYTTIHYVQKGKPDYSSAYIAEGSFTSTRPPMPEDTWVDKVKEEHLPKGQLDVSRDMTVFSEGSKVGKVDGLVLDPDSGEITHLLMRKGHLWGTKDISVPVTAIEAVDEEEIHLNIDKQAIKKLPSVKLKPHLG
jgi:sporulation protein YlmC with PRC-barrel domain